MELHLDPDPDAQPHTALPPRLESWRRRSVAGAILTGIGLGLKEVLEPKRDEPAIMIEASGDPPGDLPVEADMAGIMPADKIVRIRPWLLSQTAGTPDPGDVAQGPAGAPSSEGRARNPGDATQGPASAPGTEGRAGHPGDTP